MKNRRQDKILELIDQYDIETQDNLIERLQDAGYAATQATISRDIRELKLSKVMTGYGTYKYIRPPMADGAAGTRFNPVLIDSISRVDCAGNIVVIKTAAGMANAVATGIDAMLSGEILGSVAGDDTIIVVVRDPEAAVKTCSNLKMMLQLKA
ncbi:MAG: arginine repressor [Clostridia bacterium]|nr:arginine repressor [Clostridia bacterium]